MDVTLLGTGAMGAQDPPSPGMDVPVSSSAEKHGVIQSAQLHLREGRGGK